jgi:hypothetical protein
MNLTQKRRRFVDPLLQTIRGQSEDGKFTS